MTQLILSLIVSLSFAASNNTLELEYANKINEAKSAQEFFAKEFSSVAKTDKTFLSKKLKELEENRWSKASVQDGKISFQIKDYSVCFEISKDHKQITINGIKRNIPSNASAEMIYGVIYQTLLPKTAVWMDLFIPSANAKGPLTVANSMVAAFLGTGYWVYSSSGIQA